MDAERTLFSVMLGDSNGCDLLFNFSGGDGKVLTQQSVGGLIVAQDPLNVFPVRGTWTKVDVVI
jgi:hypothetical protein